jgi:1,2-diacylglycerol 3-alpha-glucosyltransferase
VFFEEDIFRRAVIDLYRLNADKCFNVPVGTDLSYINGINGKKQLSRSDLGLKDNDIVLITVNRLAADKGIDKIILALKELNEINPRIKLIIVGSGYFEQELIKLISVHQLNDFIIHLKDVPEEELYAYYKIADIYISACSYPGSSVSTLEAMACSLPIITTAQPWLVRNSENGVYVQNNSSYSIKEAILQLIERAQLKQQGRISQEIVQQYDWKNIIQMAKERYNGLVTATT